MPYAARWRRLVPTSLRPATHPGVVRVLCHVVHLDRVLVRSPWPALCGARSVRALRARYRVLAHRQAPPQSHVAGQVDALLRLLQQQAHAPRASVLLPEAHQRRQWAWVARTLHAAFTHPVLSELGRLRRGQLARN